MSKYFFGAIFIFLLFLPLRGFSQYYFGKNKVQYTRFEWEVLTTEHFNVYFYVEEKEIAEIAAKIAEDGYNLLQDKFNYHINKKIPLIIYSSPNYFEQTNVIPNLLPENVAGFTEFFKGRMVIPFDGSYSSFKHTIQHELVHVFTFEKLYFVMKLHRIYNYVEPPLWFQEGLAEHWSGKVDSEAEMIIKDLVISGRLVKIEHMGELAGSYLMYKEGESFCRFLEEKYGDDRLTLVFDDYWRGGNFSEVVGLIFHKSLKELGDEWEYHLKKKYFPEISSGDLPDRVATQLTFDDFSVKPTLVPYRYKGKVEDWVVFKSNKLGYSSLYLMSPRGEKEKLFTLVKGERSPQFESLHFLESKVDGSQDSRIVFISKSKEKDLLYIYDLKQMKIVQRKRFDTLISLSSPAWSEDNVKIAFSGVDKNGYTDLYLYYLLADSLVRLTKDIYKEKDPTWSKDGKTIVFSSDRTFYGQEGFQNLFSIEVSTGEIKQLTSARAHDLNPTFSKNEDKLFFTSDREGAFNLYSLDSSGIKKLTRFLTGGFDPDASGEGKELYFSGYRDYNFHIYKFSLNDSLVEFLGQEKDSLKSSWAPEKISGEHTRGVVKYENDYSFDIAQSAISYDAVYGTVGGLQLALTDMLGNHQYFFLLSNTARTKSEFFSSFNFGVTYLNRTQRLNYGFGIYHLYDEYYDDYYGFFKERQYGGLFFANYPISKFQRIESSFFLRQSDKDFYVFGRKRNVLLSTNYFSWIKDTSLWDLTGPIDGIRFNLTLGLTLSWDKLQVYNRLILADFRKYLRLGKNSCFALRLTGFSSSGTEPQRLHLGGSWSLRGYDRKAFYGKRLILINNELRFPLIDNLIIGFPFGKIGFEAIRGAFFFDAGNAWEDHFDQLYGSFGTGFRISFGYVIVLRFDFAKKTDFKSVSRETVFNFFFGWNF